MATYTGADKRLQYLFENGGGGGTTVVANPSDPATDDLEKIQIGETVYDIVGGGGAGGTSLKTYHAAWTATSASTSGTPLTDSISLPAGKYLVTADLPYSSETENSAFIGLLVDNTLRLDMLARVPRTYGQYVAELEISSPSVIQLASASNTAYTWASQYIDRGGLDVISLEVNGSSGVIDYDDLIFSDSYTCTSAPYDYTYTATEDCFCFYSMCGGANQDTYAQILDGSTVITYVAAIYNGTLLQETYWCFLPKGKTLKVHSTYRNAQLSLKAFGMKVLGGGGSGNTNSWTGTQAELIDAFDDLPDGTQINITDDEIQSLAEQRYTTAEQVIGTYLGKTLYRKTYVKNMASGSTACEFPFTDITNFEKIINLFGTFDTNVPFNLRGSAGTHVNVVPIGNYSAYGFVQSQGVRVTRNSAVEYSASPEIELTIEYTKTT